MAESRSIPTRVDDDLFAAAKAAGALQSRSAAQQITHWARLGRQLEGSGVLTSRDVAPPLLKRAMSMPEKSAVAESSTSISLPLKGIRVPADRADAKNRTSSTGKSRSSRRVRMTPPT